MKYFLCFVLALLASEAFATMQLYKLDDAAKQMGAVCLDGSPAAYYFEPATSSTDSDKWILFIEGGGWCYKPEDCLERSKTSMGSSTLRPQTIAGMAIYSSDPKVNPDFATWNHVMFAYCDGASFTGSVDDPVEVNGKKIYFRGLRNLQAIIQDLAKKHGLNKATQVLVSGCSAGGLATFIHGDRIAEMLPLTVQRYKIAPMSGMFLDHDNVLGEPVYDQQMKSVFAMQNSSFGVDSQCLVSKSPMYMYQCLFAPETASYTSSPMFVLNSMYDWWSMSCIYTAEPVDPQSSQNGNCTAVPGWGQCINSGTCSADQIHQIDQGWGEDFRKTYKSKDIFSKKGNGMFAYSCFTHCAEIMGLWGKITINGVTMRDALSKWYFSNDQDASKHTYIDCSLKDSLYCNPTCF